MSTQVTQQAYTTHTGHGPVGTLLVVLAIITALGVIAGMIGWLCSGFESWLETKCFSCVDGRIAPPPRLESEAGRDGGSQEIRVEDDDEKESPTPSTEISYV